MRTPIENFFATQRQMHGQARPRETISVGCASIPTQSLSNQSMAAWKGKTVAFTSRPRPSMVMMTAGKGALGLIGVAAGVSGGNALVKEDNIPDPAPVVADELLQIAEKQYGVVPPVLRLQLSTPGTLQSSPRQGRVQTSSSTSSPSARESITTLRTGVTTG